MAMNRQGRGKGAEVETGPLSSAVERLYQFRIRTAPSEIRTRLIGKGPIKHRAWRDGPVIGLHVGSPTEIRDAERRLIKWEEAYPGLLGPRPMMNLHDLLRMPNAVIQNVKVPDGHQLLHIEGQTSVALRKITLTPIQNQIPYVISFMAIVSVTSEDQLLFSGMSLLDALLAKEIARARMSNDDHR